MAERYKSAVKRLMAQGCPSKEHAVAIAEAEAMRDIRAAQRVLADFERRGGTTLEELKRELDL